MSRVIRAICTMLAGCTPFAVLATNFSFQSPTLLWPTGSRPISVAFGDIDGDLAADLVSVNRADSGDYRYYVVVHMRGLRTIVSYTNDFSWAMHGEGIELVDLNGDGRKEIILGLSDRLMILSPNEDPRDFSRSEYPVGGWGALNSVVSLDYNADGRLDLLASRRGWDDIEVFLGTGAGSIGNQFSEPARGIALSSGDLNGDGHADLATTSLLNLRLSSKTGQLGAWQEFDDAWSDQVVIGDASSDGLADLALLYCTPTQAFEYFETSELGLVGPKPVAGPCGSRLALRDVDQDGIGDAVLAGHNLALFKGSEAGLTYAASFPLVSGGEQPAQGQESFALGDLDGDGCIDAAIADPNRGLWLASGQGCAPAVDFGVAMSVVSFSGSPNALDITVANVSTNYGSEWTLDVSIQTRDRVEIPEGCEVRLVSRSETRFSCQGWWTWPGAAGGTSVLMANMTDTWNVSARISGPLSDPDMENNTARRSFRPR